MIRRRLTADRRRVSGLIVATAIIGATGAIAAGQDRVSADLRVEVTVVRGCTITTGERPPSTLSPAEAVRVSCSNGAAQRPVVTSGVSKEGAQERRRMGNAESSGSRPVLINF